MPSGAKSGFGTTLVADSNTMGEITTIDLPGIDDDVIEVTNHDSENGLKEYVAGLGDGGEVSGEVNFLPADYETWRGLRRAIKTFVITLPPAVTSNNIYTFSGILQQFDASAPHDDKMSASFSIKVTGDVAITSSP